MAVLSTLATTTLSQSCTALDGQIEVASTSGVTPGVRLYVDRELLAVVRIGIDSWVEVLRGVDGTAATAHASSTTITIGRADQFYSQDPVGPPLSEVLVSPWINVVTGTQWTAQGDEAGPDVAARWWAQTVTTHGAGALGVRTATSAASVTTST